MKRPWRHTHTLVLVSADGMELSDEVCFEPDSAGDGPALLRREWGRKGAPEYERRGGQWLVGGESTLNDLPFLVHVTEAGASSEMAGLPNLEAGLSHPPEAQALFSSVVGRWGQKNPVAGRPSVTGEFRLLDVVRGLFRRTLVTGGTFAETGHFQVSKVVGTKMVVRHLEARDLHLWYLDQDDQLVVSTSLEDLPTRLERILSDCATGPAPADDTSQPGGEGLAGRSEGERGPLSKVKQAVSHPLTAQVLFSMLVGRWVCDSHMWIPTVTTSHELLDATRGVFRCATEVQGQELVRHWQVRVVRSTAVQVVKLETGETSTWELLPDGKLACGNPRNETPLYFERRPVAIQDSARGNPDDHASAAAASEATRFVWTHTLRVRVGDEQEVPFEVCFEPDDQGDGPAFLELEWGNVDRPKFEHREGRWFFDGEPTMFGLPFEMEVADHRGTNVDAPLAPGLRAKVSNYMSHPPPAQALFGLVAGEWDLNNPFGWLPSVSATYELLDPSRGVFRRTIVIGDQDEEVGHFQVHDVRDRIMALRELENGEISHLYLRDDDELVIKTKDGEPMLFERF